ncbi:ABC transporter [Candidatus Beckwithbacteria bacterium CG10_big_fil_rev_8_21_14_0_10_34_10]|uniref:Transport permease protein n=1 Tax=Candidatus Beckwithbacteria bacterium CG10_big_fil_rev_8_21_14_0_10_34_10 TaxID=1974495 RepID=A0A2H0WA06_9BACT|nr:MAG: ABC transporter [Candidatus Beckwithbacteria bacterium CG10_big_fil_rev_8_21_14_0_10_34_10]
MNIFRIRAVILRHLYNFRHHLDRLTDSFYWPAMDIVLWGLTSQYIQSSGEKVNHIVLILLSALVFWQVIWRGQYEITTNFLEELWSQNLLNMFSSPLTLGEWVVGIIILGIIKMAVTIIFAIFLVWALYSVNILNLGLLLIPFFLSLLMMGWWVGFFVTSVLVRFGRQLQTLAWSGVYLLAPFSAIYYPVSSLPTWAQVVAKAIPASYIFEGMRQALLTGEIPVQKLILSFGLNIMYLIISLVVFKQSFKKSKELGLARLDSS